MSDDYSAYTKATISQLRAKGSDEVKAGQISDEFLLFASAQDMWCWVL
jgi:hypothetical protein